VLPRGRKPSGLTDTPVCGWAATFNTLPGAYVAPGGSSLISTVCTTLPGTGAKYAAGPTELFGVVPGGTIGAAGSAKRIRGAADDATSSGGDGTARNWTGIVGSGAAPTGVIGGGGSDAKDACAATGTTGCGACGWKNIAGEF
jgi:hypothetical protein